MALGENRYVCESLCFVKNNCSGLTTATAIQAVEHLLNESFLLRVKASDGGVFQSRVALKVIELLVFHSIGRVKTYTMGGTSFVQLPKILSNENTAICEIFRKTF